MINIFAVFFEGFTEECLLLRAGAFFPPPLLTPAMHKSQWKDFQTLLRRLSLIILRTPARAIRSLAVYPLIFQVFTMQTTMLTEVVA